MSTFKFDPGEYIRGIQQMLVSDKKKIGFLFGAGTSLATKNKKSLTVPAIGKMTVDILKKIGSKDKKYDDFFVQVKKELPDNMFNIETIMGITSL